MAIVFHNPCFYCNACKECGDCPGCKTWTAIVRWDESGDVEEVDVGAPSRVAAEKAAEKVLEEDYIPGWKILEVFPRPPGISHIT